MSVTIPKTNDLINRNIAIFEGKLSQTVPATDKAFIKVLSVVLGVAETEIDRKVISDAKQNLALTADREGLILLGEDQGIVPNPAVATVLTGTITGVSGSTIPATVSFVGNSNGVRYFLSSSFAESGGLITPTMTAENTGSVGNLEVGDELTISSIIAGVGSVLTVTAIDTTGADEETTESLRRRILNNQRTLRGGGNSADYRRWAEEVSGVEIAFPYSKLPWDDASYPGVPPERTVYIQATTDIDIDGIPPASLLEDVRDSITTDPETGLSRQPLGLTDDTLYIEPIFVTTLYIQIVGLDVPAAQEAAIKTLIGTGIEEFLYNAQQFITGLDFADDQNNIITTVSLSDLVQGIISVVGGSAEEINFGTASGTYTTTIYTLSEGEKVKSGGVVYA